MPRRQLMFEEALKRLEEIVERLESDEVLLDESLRIFQEGIELYRFCHKRLTEAEQKVKVLIENANAEFRLEDLELKDEATAKESET